MSINCLKYTRRGQQKFTKILLYYKDVHFVVTWFPWLKMTLKIVNHLSVQKHRTCMYYVVLFSLVLKIWICTNHSTLSGICNYFLCLAYVIYNVCVCPDVWYLSPLVCVFFLLLIPLWVLIARRSPQIKEILKSGWQPVIVAMSISRCKRAYRDSLL